ncbi:MAG: LysM peptidoglycan-binding domain-containing protein [Chloroflexi bacterium]|nr:LysM peptidoglycan-binding domain-containing protein [Chloroflexota bacterium]
MNPRFFTRAAILSTILLGAILLAPTRASAAPPQDNPTTYIVQAGDTLFGIASRYQTTVAALKKLNNLTSDTILVGQKLLVPSGNAPIPASAYIVQPGDTLYAIALRHGTTLRALADLNGLANANLISEGEPLAVPINAAVAKPDFIIDPPAARQGGTILIQLARANLASASLNINAQTIPLTRAAGFFYALAGISRCAKIGNAALAISTTDADGQDASEKISLAVAVTAFPVDYLTLPPAASAILNDSALIKRESDQVAAIVGKFSPARLWSGAFRQPLTGTVTELFGTRRSYNGGAVGACGHEGMDFGAKLGAPAYADARGRVVLAQKTQVRGNLVLIDHGLGVFSGFYHLSEIDTQVGKMVEPGELIGKVGSTGLSTGPHLHWSMWVNGEYVDPLEWTRRIMP